MAIQPLNDTALTFDDGLDAVVIRSCWSTIPGGRTLDNTGFTPTVIRKGHVIIKANGAGGEYKPMPVTGVNAIGALGVAAAGSGYVNAGTYAAVALTGGTGTGATANITVFDGHVTSVTLVNKGTGYTAGDVLSAAASTIGTGGTGFSVPVASTLAGGAYAALPASHSYVGIAQHSCLTAKPSIGIMDGGNFNPVAAPYDFATIAAAFKTAVPTIIAQAD